MGTAFIDAHEKAPEMFNHFRGFVLLNNGGEIGIRTRTIALAGRYRPLNTEAHLNFHGLERPMAGCNLP